MQRLIVPALLASLFTITGAAAGPLGLEGQSYPDYSPLAARGTEPPQVARPAALAAVFAEPPAAETPPARTRTAAAESNYGGGFLEMLFRGPGAQQYAPR